MHARYLKDEVNQHSIGFHTVKQEQQKDYNEIREIMLLEGSAVLWGANPETPTIMAKTFVSKQDIIKEISDVSGDFKQYLKTGLSVDDAYFFGKHLEQLEQKLIDWELERQEEITQKSGTSTFAVTDPLSQFIFKTI